MILAPRKQRVSSSVDFTSIGYAVIIYVQVVQYNTFKILPYHNYQYCTRILTWHVEWKNQSGTRTTAWKRRQGGKFH